MLFDTTGNNTGDSDEITTTSSTATVVNLIIEFSSAVSGFSFVPGTSVSFTANSSWATTTDSQTLVSGTKFHIGEWTLQSGAPATGSLEVSLSLSGITSDNGASMGSAPANVTWNFNRGFYLRWFDSNAIMGDFKCMINTDDHTQNWNGTSGRFETHTWQHDAGPNSNGWVFSTTICSNYDLFAPMVHVCPNHYSNFTTMTGPARPTTSSHPGYRLTGNDYIIVKYWYTNGEHDDAPIPLAPRFFYYDDGTDFHNSSHHHGSSDGYTHNISATNTGDYPQGNGYAFPPAYTIHEDGNFSANFTELMAGRRPIITGVSDDGSHPDYDNPPHIPVTENWSYQRVRDIDQGNDEQRVARASGKPFYRKWRLDPPSGGWGDFALGTPFIYMVFTHYDDD